MLYHESPGLTLHHGDALTVLRELPADSVQTVVTSPPYYQLRDYGVDGQLGLEGSPAEYIATLVDVFREVRRVLRADGTCWINISDTYAGGSPGRNDLDEENIARRSAAYGTGTRQALNGENRKSGGRLATDAGVPRKNLLGIPWRLAFALQSDGWYLRADIIWAKPNAMPESVTDRPTRSHEYIFLLTKSERYYYDANAVREPFSGDTRGHGLHSGYAPPVQVAHQGARHEYNGKHSPASHKGSTFHRGKTAKHQLGRASDGDRIDPLGGRNKRSVWTIATQPYAGQHYATYPPKLVEPCILAGTQPGDTVLDPFVGSGTTALVALKHGRQCIGIDLDAKALDQAIERTAQRTLWFDTESEAPDAA